MKGLTVVAVPAFCILMHALIKRDWAWLPPLKTILLTFFISSLVFLVLPIYASFDASSWEPLRLVWKENFLRFFQPFDHKAPFYLYTYRIFDLAAPWSLFLLPALFAYWKDGHFRNNKLTDILLFFGGIFLFFTLSGSRRPYYLLPILPFVAILVAYFLLRFQRGELQQGLSRLTTGLGLFLAIILMLPLPVLLLKPAFMPPGFTQFLPLSMILGVCSLVLAAGFIKRHSLSIVAAIAIVWCGFVLVVVPWAATRPGNVRDATAYVAAQGKPVAFLLTDDAKIIYYLNRPYDIMPDIDQASSWARHTGGILITYYVLNDSQWSRLVQDGSWKAYQLKTTPAQNTSFPYQSKDKTGGLLLHPQMPRGMHP
jgi:hypothetical protein